MDKIQKLGQWLSQFPYENLSKRNQQEPRTVALLLEEHEQLGTGGTCFSLVNLATKKAREWNIEPRFYLGERPDGEGRHCAIGFPREDVFLDPGYLCFDPLPLHPVNDQQIIRPHNILHLEIEDASHLKISTERKGQKTWRYTLHTKPVDRATFETAWRESFGWKSVMNSRVLTRARRADIIIYLNGRLESITREKRTRLTPSENINSHRYLSEIFGLSEDLIRSWELEIQS